MISKKSVFYLFAITVMAIYSCNQVKNNPNTPSNSEAGKILVIDATEHTESESPVLNAYMNSLWQVDSMLYTYENPDLKPPFDPLFIYDVIEPKTFMESMKANGNGVLNQQKSPMILIFTDPHSEELSSESKDIIAQLNRFDPIKKIQLQNPVNGENKTVNIYQNVWSKDQWVVEFLCNSANCATEIAQMGKILENELLNLEFSLGCNSLAGESPFRDSLVKTVLNAKYSIDIPLAYNYVMAMEKSDIDGKILWFRNETPQSHSNIFIQIKPYFNPQNWTKDSFISERNRTTKKWLRNEEGGWVEVTESAAFPMKITHDSKTQNRLYFEGWYSELNTSRRGPFIREYILDPSHDRTIIVDGFLFAPNQSRTQLMREIKRYVLLAKSL